MSKTETVNKINKLRSSQKDINNKSKQLKINSINLSIIIFSNTKFCQWIKNQLIYNRNLR